MLDTAPLIAAWTTFHQYATTTATIISMFALFVVVYSFMKISEMAAEETKRLHSALNWENVVAVQKNSRWDAVEKHIASHNPSDWRVAIIEADTILEEIVDRMGFHGATLGERMKSMTPTDFPHLQEVWTAHKLRNTIAHEGMTFELSRKEAEDAINTYHRVFKELEYL